MSISKILNNILCNSSPSGLKISHLNAQSSLPKIDEFRFLFTKSSFDVICVSETWFKPHVKDNLVNLKNYKLFRNDRVNRIGGGVAFYVKSNNFSCLVCSSECIGSIEFIFIEILNNSERCLIGCIYKPPNVNDLDPFIAVLSQFSCLYSIVALVFDFNIDMMKDSPYSCNFRQLIEYFGLHIKKYLSYLFYSLFFLTIEPSLH